LKGVNFDSSREAGARSRKVSWEASVHRRWLSDLVVPTETGKDRDGAPPPGIFRLVAIGELVGYKPCAILAASWWVSGDEGSDCELDHFPRFVTIAKSASARASLARCRCRDARP
jgi:hypothetical protein